MTGHGRPIHDAFYPSSDASGRLVLGCPDWFENVQHLLSSDVRAGDFSDHRMGVGCECVGPLLSMFDILPAMLLGLDVLLCCQFKSHDIGSSDGGSLCSTSFNPWVNSLTNKLALLGGQFSCFNRDFLSLDDLVGKKLGVLAQTGIEGQARAALGKSVVAYARIEDALKDLAVKKLDVVLEENLIAEYYIERDDLPVKVTAPFAPPIPVGLAVHKGRRETQDKLADAVKTMLKDGSLKAISEKWFGYDVSRASMGHAMSS